MKGYWFVTIKEFPISWEVVKTKKFKGEDGVKKINFTIKLINDATKEAFFANIDMDYGFYKWKDWQAALNDNVKHWIRDNKQLLGQCYNDAEIEVSAIF